MQMESLGKMLPAILFPYVQQWAERSGLTLLAQLLVDEQFRALFEKYGDEIVRNTVQGRGMPGNGNGRGHGKGSAPHAEPRVGKAASDFTNLQDRVLAMETQQEAQQALFVLLRSKMRPLALALGCCPECLVGVDLCPKCWGRSRVAHFPPNYGLLEAQIVKPLAACGVPLVLSARKAPSTRKSTAMRKGVSHAGTNDARECLGE
jgi:hypothetical protein